MHILENAKHNSDISAYETQRIFVWADSRQDMFW